jgi:hypothetical protein
MATQKTKRKLKLNKSRKKQTLTKSRKFKSLKCSTNESENDFSCYTNKSLFKLKCLWNTRHKDRLIKTNNPKEIWDYLKSQLDNVCSNEKCWLEQQFSVNNLDKELKDETFAPYAPTTWKTNPNEWLSSVDIENVMKQYENKYKCFSFIGPSPIDFDNHIIYGQCVWEELCKFDINTYLNKNKTKIGIVFNLDPHYKSGSHWVSLFINLKKGYLFYFDSAGDKIPSQIKNLVVKIIKQATLMDIKMKFEENHPFEHQEGNTECGMYSLFFITEMLKDKKTIRDFQTKKYADHQISKFRDIYFNHK